MPRCQEPSDAVEGEAEVVAVAQLGHAGVEGHAHAEGADFVPGLGVERVGSSGEGSTEGIADSFEDTAAMSVDGVPEEHVMARKRRGHGLGMLLPEAGAALDVGEEKGNRPRRQARPGYPYCSLAIHGGLRLRFKCSGTHMTPSMLVMLVYKGDDLWQASFTVGEGCLSFS
jgi:hypothetical protein